jgi:RHS repeat-associated protein
VCANDQTTPHNRYARRQNRRFCGCLRSALTNEYIVVTDTRASRNVYFGGRLIQSNGQTVVTDRLGSVRMTEAGAGAGYYPYGEQESVTLGNGLEKFGTYTRELASGLDYANQRYYASVFGRFNTPDRYQASGGAADPGSGNRYAYVVGDPINFSDPTGSIKFLPGSDPTDFESQPCMEPGRNGINNYWEYVDNFPNVGCIVGGVAYFGGKPGRGGGDDNSHLEAPATPQCDIQLRDTGIPGTRNKAVHSYLEVLDSSGATHVLEGIQSSVARSFIPRFAYLNGSDTPDGGLNIDHPATDHLDFDSKDHAGLGNICDFVSTLISQTAGFPNNKVHYDLLGKLAPNSNSFIRHLLTSIPSIPDLGITSPSGAVGWNHLIFGQ